MFRTANKVIADACLWLGGIAMALMAVMTVTDIFLRYVFHAPLPGTSEHTQILMAIIVFSGLVIVTREGTHIVVSLFKDQMNRIAPGLFDRVYFVSTIIGLGLISYAMIVTCRDMWEYEEETLVMEYPLIRLGVVILFLLVLAFLQLRHLATEGPLSHDLKDVE